MDELDRIQEMEEQRLADGIARVQREVASAKTLAQKHCDDCGAEIPMARRKAVPNTKHCVDCKSKAERH